MVSPAGLARRWQPGALPGVLGWGVRESVAERGAAVQDAPAGPGAGEESGLAQDGQVGTGAAEAHGGLLGELAGGGGGVEGAQ